MEDVMADALDSDKIVAAILAAAKISQGEEHSTERYLDAYEEMRKAMADRQRPADTTWAQGLAATARNEAKRS
jgi:hypothetical protein